jgi:HK97 family phage major capsid protein
MSYEVRNIRAANARVNEMLLEAQNISKMPGGLTPERRNRYNALIAKSNEILDAIQDASDREGRSFTPSPRPAMNRPFDEEQGAQAQEDRARSKKKWTAAFRAYAKHGFGGLTPEQRSLVTTSDATGGALISQTFLGELFEAQRFYGPIATKVKNVVTQNNGAPLKISLTDDTENGIVLLGTEGTSSPSETDPAFQSKILGIDTVSLGLVKISFQELEDSAFDLDSFIRESLGKRYARGLAKAVTTGVDSAGTVLPNQGSGGLLGAAAVGAQTSVLANGIGWQDLTALFGALDASYIVPGRTSWVMNTSTRATLLGMKDGLTS